jgi:hypothetical protein
LVRAYNYLDPWKLKHWMGGKTGRAARTFRLFDI